METLALFIGFIGSWLLFAGPLYQAALELQDEDIELDRIREAGAKVEKPKIISAWWWILPPIKFYLEFKARRNYQYRYLKALSQEDVEAMISYRSKASAWLFVASGGFLIASKESYELLHHLEVSYWILLLVILLMLILSFANMITQVKRAKYIVTKKREHSSSHA